MATIEGPNDQEGELATAVWFNSQFDNSGWQVGYCSFLLANFPTPTHPSHSPPPPKLPLIAFSSLNYNIVITLLVMTDILD